MALYLWDVYSLGSCQSYEVGIGFGCCRQYVRLGARALSRSAYLVSSDCQGGIRRQWHFKFIGTWYVYLRACQRFRRP